jgi:hypothetical protein
MKDIHLKQFFKSAGERVKPIINPNTKNGGFVSRAVYQKVMEENKRLIVDIKILTEYTRLPAGEKEALIREWKEVFAKEKELMVVVKQLLRQTKDEEV